MRLNLFVCPDGYLLSNECMLASREAEAAHGPVSAFLGVLDCALLPEADCDAIVEAILARQYAHLPLQRGQALGITHLVSNTPPRRMLDPVD